MPGRIRLREICHSRAGDKGDISNISLIVYDIADYELVRRAVTAERVKAHFRGIAHGRVERYELPGIGAMNFVLHEALDAASHARCASTPMANRSALTCWPWKSTCRRSFRPIVVDPSGLVERTLTSRRNPLASRIGAAFKALAVDGNGVQARGQVT